MVENVKIFLFSVRTALVVPEPMGIWHAGS